MKAFLLLLLLLLLSTNSLNFEGVSEDCLPLLLLVALYRIGGARVWAQLERVRQEAAAVERRTAIVERGLKELSRGRFRRRAMLHGGLLLGRNEWAPLNNREKRATNVWSNDFLKTFLLRKSMTKPKERCPSKFFGGFIDVGTTIIKLTRFSLSLS